MVAVGLYVSQASSYNFNGEFFCLYGPPILLTLAVYFSILYIFKTWVCDREVATDFKDRRNNYQRYHVPGWSFRSQYSRRSGRRLSRRSKRGNIEDVKMVIITINFEEEIAKPYCQALMTLYPEEQIKKAMVYMNRKGNFVDQKKTAIILGKNIQHIENLEKWEKDLRNEREPGAEFPKELSKKDLEDYLLKFDSWDRGEISLILNQSYVDYGFYPIPTEFCAIYEGKKGKLDQLVMTRSKLEKEVDTLQQENISLKQACLEQDDLKRMNAELQRTNSSLEQRHFCKICFVNEMTIVVFPCKHMYSCQDCYERFNRKCLICHKIVERHEKILLA